VSRPGTCCLNASRMKLPDRDTGLHLKQTKRNSPTEPTHSPKVTQARPRAAYVLLANKTRRMKPSIGLRQNLAG
ncbi:hypothetical protein, partial [Cerasicoccus arenae]|uniref:hypothetical protein n=1 Tax=Cerasicoccus arenae TaxID=424488 RepID=UPI001F34003F